MHQLVRQIVAIGSRALARVARIALTFTIKPSREWHFPRHLRPRLAARPLRRRSAAKARPQRVKASVPPVPRPRLSPKPGLNPRDREKVPSPSSAWIFKRVVVETRIVVTATPRRPLLRSTLK